MLPDDRDQEDAGSSSLIAILFEISLYFPGCHSLKEKRQRLRSIMESIFPRFGACVSEIAHQDHHQQITLGAAMVSGSPYDIRLRAQGLIRTLRNDGRFEILSVKQKEVKP